MLTRTRIIIISAMLLTSCAQIREAVETRRNCEQMAAQQGRNQEWIDRCIAGDIVAIREGIMTSLASKSDTELCTTLATNYGLVLGNYAEEERGLRKLNCDPMIASSSYTAFKNAPVDNICTMWYNHTGHPLVLKSIDTITLERKLDCVQVVNGLKQERALQAQAEAQRSAARAAYQQIDAINRTFNKSVTCNTIGSMTTCQ